MASSTFLLELGVEELPPGAIDSLADALAEGLRRGLGEAEIDFGAIRAEHVEPAVRDVLDAQRRALGAADATD